MEKNDRLAGSADLAKEVVSSGNPAGRPDNNKNLPWPVVHVPHNSTNIPFLFLREFLADENKIQQELLRMTDWYTEELFTCEGWQSVVHHYSRLVCDPERFLDPDEEGMCLHGMGMYYLRTSDGGRLKRHPFSAMEAWWAYGTALQIYQQHHCRLRNAVQKQLDHFGAAVLLDGHSFSSAVLPYEPAANRKLARPDICLGTDEHFTPAALLDSAVSYFKREGMRVSVNTPFAGTMVPQPFYSDRDRRVKSLMLEVNRSLYMDEAAGCKNKQFAEIKHMIRGFMEMIKREFPAV